MESAAKVTSQLGVYGLALAATLAAVFGIAGAIIGGGLSSISSSEESAADKITDLSAGIYKLSTRASELNTLTDSYEKLDRQIIKTAEDQKEMNSILDEAADKMSDEQKTVYQSLTTNQQRLEYIKKIATQSKSEAAANRIEQLNLIRDNPGLLTGTSDDAQQVQSAVYATANQYLYDWVDEKGYDTDVETFTQNLLEGMSATDSYLYALNPQKIYDLADAIAELDIADPLLSSSSSLTDRVNAYKTASGEIKDLIDNVYPQLETLSSWSPDLLT